MENSSYYSSKPVRILITGAAGNIGYSLSFMIAQGRMFGDKIPVILHLFDLPQMEEALKGVHMELIDGAFDLLKGVVITSDPAIGFNHIDYAILCGAKPRLQGMERKDLLTANAKIFAEQGKYLDTYAKKTVKVLVVGNPANTNAIMLAKNSPSIPKQNFAALSRLVCRLLVAVSSAYLASFTEKTALRFEPQAYLPNQDLL